MADLILVRHGETVGESSIRLYGRTDIELSDLGRDQMRRAGDALAHIDFRSVFVSPLARSAESARIILAGRGPAPVVVPEFAEIDFGDWEGWSLAEAEARDPEAFKARRVEGANFRFPGGESKLEFFSRCSDAANRLFSAAPAPALAVIHKGVIKGALAGLLDVTVHDMNDHPIELGSFHRLEKSGHSWRLLSTNETAHLGDLRLPGSV